MRRVDSLEKTDAGRDWGQEEKENIVVFLHLHHQHSSWLGTQCMEKGGVMNIPRKDAFGTSEQLTV